MLKRINIRHFISFQQEFYVERNNRIYGTGGSRMSKKIIDSVSELIQPIVLERDLELVDIEYVKEGPGWFLRVYLDKDGGIDLIECSLVSERLSKLLDEHDLIKEAYYLEVSSPGAERPLKTKEDILQHVGHNVYVSLYAPVVGEKEY